MLSIVIPVLNEGLALPIFLEHLHALKSSDVDIELIGVDGGSADDSYAYLQQYCDIALSSAPGRAKQMNLGAQRAHGEQLIFLHADTFLNIDTLKHIRSTLKNHQWGRCQVLFDPSSPLLTLVAWMMNTRSRFTHVATGDQALFFNASFFKRIGQFPEIALMEDVAMSKIARKSGKFSAINSYVMTSSRRWKHNGTIKTIWLMWRLRLAYFFGTSPDHLAKKYYQS